MNEIVPKFKDSLVLNTTDLIQDYAEIGIDSIIDNEIVNSIPIVKTIISTGKIIYNVSERNLAKNLVIFINELNSGNIDKTKLEKHIKSLDDKKTAEKELERFLIILNQTIDNEKSILYGKIYKSYINQNITWDELCEFTDIVSRMFIQDLKVLKDIFLGKQMVVTNRSSVFKVERLYSLGIVGFSPKALYPGGGTENYVNLNELGKKFTSIIFN